MRGSGGSDLLAKMYFERDGCKRNIAVKAVLN